MLDIFCYFLLFGFLCGIVSGSEWQKVNSYEGDWSDICSSWNATFLAASATKSSSKSGGIYLSFDEGVTWTASPGASTSLDWFALDCDSTGRRLIAAELNTGYYISDDFGMNWNKTLDIASVSTNDLSVCMTSSGQYVVAATAGEGIFVSSTYGTNWTLSSFPTGCEWEAVACSENCSYILATCGGSSSSSGMYLSTDLGATYTNDRYFNLYQAYVSFDASVMMVADQTAALYQSLDFGATWTTVETGAWYCLAGSKYGQTVVAGMGPFGDELAFSYDYGNTDSWVVANSVPSGLSWTGASVNEDGSIAVAVASGNGIYINSIAPSQVPSSAPSSPTSQPSCNPSTGPTLAPTGCPGLVSQLAKLEWQIGKCTRNRRSYCYERSNVSLGKRGKNQRTVDRMPTGDQ